MRFQYLNISISDLVKNSSYLFFILISYTAFAQIQSFKLQEVRSSHGCIFYQLLNKNQEDKFLDISALDELKLDNVKISINAKPAEIISTENKTIRIKLSDVEVVNLKVKLTNYSQYLEFTD